MSVDLIKHPAVILARQSWTGETFRASLTAVPLSDALSVPRQSRRGGWNFHLVTASQQALRAPYSPQAADALNRAEKI